MIHVLLIVLFIVLGIYAAGFVLMACLPQWRGDGLGDRLIAGAVWPYVVVAVVIAIWMPTFTPREGAKRSNARPKPTI